MSFLKKYNIRNKINDLKIFFIDYVYIKSSVYMIAASIIVSLVVIQVTPAKFYVSATLRETQVTETQGVNIQGNSTVSSLLSLQGSDSNTFNEFNSNLHSYILAQRMWDKGWGEVIFGEQNEDNAEPGKFRKKHKISERLSAFFLGYKLFEYYSPNDLQEYIQGTVFAEKAIQGTNITVYMMAEDKDFALAFLDDLIIETDRYAKEHLIAKSKAIISGTFDQLAVSKNASITASLSATINSEYFKIASLENDMPYHIYFIDPPHSSEYPVTPNIAATFVSSFIIFLFLSIAYSFTHKNKEDLW